MQDVRWRQRFQHYQSALQTVREAVDLVQQRPLTRLEQQGLIQGFEFTHELGWNLLKDYLQERGIAGIVGSKDAVRLAFRHGLLEDGEVWMEMIRMRNLTSHTYNLQLADAVAQSIVAQFYPAFLHLEQVFHALSLQEDAP